MQTSASTAPEQNARVWENLYAAGRNDLRYPNESLVRLAGRLLPVHRALRVLDYGFGTGANLMHLAGMGHDVSGVEVSPSAVATVRQRIAERGLSASVQLVEAGARLPFADRTFDAVIAWQVLCYNDLSTWASAVSELERVGRPGGMVIVATAAPGDVSQVNADDLGDGLYRSRVPEQDGCIMTIPDRHQLPSLFPGRELELGEFQHVYAGTCSRHWIIVYRLPER